MKNIALQGQYVEMELHALEKTIVMETSGV